MSWTAAQPSNHHHFPRTHIQDEKGSSNCCHMPWATAPSHQKKAENVNSNVKVGGLGKHTEELRREGELGPWAASAPPTTSCLSSLLHKLFPVRSSSRNWKLPWWKLHHTAVFVCSLLQHWLSTTKTGKKTTQIPPKSASSIFFCNSFNCQTSS